MITKYSEVPVTQVNATNVRRVLAHGEKLMLVEFRFAKGGIGEQHKHDAHDQVGYVAKGSFEITVDGKMTVAHVGDTYYAAPGVMHGVVALEEDSVLVDAFTPQRADFL